ncbi:hypothetical protein A6770_22055 [Nostoc minutum NIES-26]|uniref:Uncharacterized protein n=1 Tax=Nostoc minutum NIES-26 TaxID=1844469 RepID=A0A367QYX3_9NOSO|nr:hypothetical protein A6770_22055 [Nostoc minutum NIES-26]
MISIDWSLKVQVNGEEEISTSEGNYVEAYQRIEVEIPPGGSEKVIDLQPSSAAKVSFILIKRATYDSNDDKLTYKVSNGDATKDSKVIVLNGTHIYTKGILSSLFPDPKILKFTNNHPVNDTTKKIPIQILLGRDALN